MFLLAQKLKKQPKLKQNKIREIRQRKEVRKMQKRKEKQKTAPNQVKPKNPPTQTTRLQRQKGTLLSLPL